jgi:hypothetical protein
VEKATAWLLLEVKKSTSWLLPEVKNSTSLGPPPLAGDARFFNVFLADPGKAMGCSTNTFIFNSVSQ